jgi:hypothetical protein
MVQHSDEHQRVLGAKVKFETETETTGSLSASGDSL